MKKTLSWFCADSEMPQDPRLASLPDNDYRWTFFCFLALEKRGNLEDQNPLDFAHYCHTSPEKFPMILDLLREKGLLDEGYRPVKFDEWQQSALKAQRNKRFRDGAKTPPKKDAMETQGSQEETLGSPSETHTETDTDSKNSSCPNSGELEPVKNFPMEAIKLSELLANSMLSNNPKAKLPKTMPLIDKWHDAIDKINRIDGYSWEDIENVIRWCQNDEFWKGNILSAQKLRKQFSQLIVKMRSKPNQSGKFGVADGIKATMRNKAERMRNEERPQIDSTRNRGIGDGGNSF